MPWMRTTRACVCYSTRYIEESRRRAEGGFFLRGPAVAHREDLREAAVGVGSS